MNGEKMNRNAADALRETADTLRGMAAALAVEADRMSEEMEMIERAQAMPAGYVEHKVFSEYSGSHSEYCSEWEEIFIAVPAGVAVSEMKLYHMTNSSGNRSECFAALPGCKVWNGAAWCEPQEVYG
jgi:hypothetical protein